MRTDTRAFTDGLNNRRWGAAVLGTLVAIPLAGFLGLPLLIFLLLLFGLDPGGLGKRLGQCQLLHNIPGFRSGRRIYMAAASILYLLPISLLGMLVISVDGMILKIFP